MLRIKLQFIAVLVWFTLIFMLDRLVLVGQPLDLYVHLLLIAVTSVMFLLPAPVQKNPVVAAVLVAILYVVGYALFATNRPEDFGSAILSGKFLVGGIFVLVTFALMYWVTSTLTELTRTSEKIAVANGIMPVSPWLEGEIRINDELNRCRRFERSASVIFCSLSQNGDKAINQTQQRQLIQAIASITFKSDIVTEYEDGMVVVLPEAERKEASVFVGQLGKILIDTMKINPFIGSATFSEDGQVAIDLVKVAQGSAKLMTENDVDSYMGYRKGDLVVDLEERVRIERQSEWVNRMPMHTPESRQTFRVIKRAIDIAFIVALMPALLPVLGIVALLIYLDDRDKIFYMQPRTGYAGKRFHMYKFRTMRVGAKSVPPTMVVAPDGSMRYMWPEKVDDDPRITRVGRILRKTSLDELPQLLNILKGDMSLIGPRPTSWSLDMYTPMQTARLGVAPGITGLWQVSARDATNFDERLIWDMKYIEKASLWLDIIIVWRTVVGVFQKSGV